MFICRPFIEALNKKTPTTRRKRLNAIEKSTISHESSDDGDGKDKHIKGRRSRSKSNEVGRKRGRPRKNQTPTNSVDVLKR